MTSYLRKGSGTPVVLVHGLGSRWECYEPVIDILAEQHDVIAVDLPGFGDTPLASGVEPGARGYARWLTDFLAELEVSDPHVVGNSMGGGVALEMGRAGAAARVTAFSPIGFWEMPGRIWTQALLTGLRQGGQLAEPVLARLVQVPALKAVLVSSMMNPRRVSPDDALRHADGLIRAEGFPAARNSFSHYTLREDDAQGSLTDIPVTIAWGTRDVVLTHRTQSARARRFMPFARHVDLPRCGHVPFSDDPGLCARVILGEA